MMVEGWVIDLTTYDAEGDSLREWHVEDDRPLLLVFRPDDAANPQSWRIAYWEQQEKP